VIKYWIFLRTIITPQTDEVISFDTPSTGDTLLVQENICSHSSLLIARVSQCFRSTISCDRQLRSCKDMRSFL